MFRLKLPLAVGPTTSALDPYDLAIGGLRALMLQVPATDDPEELRLRRKRARRNQDPLAPERLPARRRARALEVALRRGEDEAWRREEAARQAAARDRSAARRATVAARRAEWERVEAENQTLLGWLNLAPIPIRRSVRLLAWAALGQLDRRSCAHGELLLAHRRAVVEVLRAESVGLCRFPLARVS